MTGPTNAVIGKPNVHRNGKNHDSDCTQSGISVIGTNRPESSNSARKYASKMAPIRVVQKVIIPSTHRSNERMRYAPQMATKNTMICPAVGDSDGRKITDKTTAIGNHSAITVTLVPANSARS